MDKLINKQDDIIESLFVIAYKFELQMFIVKIDDSIYFINKWNMNPEHLFILEYLKKHYL